MNDFSVSRTPPNRQPDNVKKWQELDLSTPEGLRALDIVIAMRLGWKGFIEEEYWIEDWDAYDPAEDWFAMPPNSEYKSLVPRYSTNLNAAFKLAYAQVYITTRRGNQDEQIWGVRLNLRREIYQDTSLAVAICKAWLGWQDWQEAEDADPDAAGGVK